MGYLPVQTVLEGDNMETWVQQINVMSPDKLLEPSQLAPAPFISKLRNTSFVYFMFVSFG